MKQADNRTDDLTFQSINNIYLLGKPVQFLEVNFIGVTTLGTVGFYLLLKCLLSPNSYFKYFQKYSS